MSACAVALVLAMDVSASVSTASYELQRNATADALTSAPVLAAARDGLAVSTIMWGTGQHVVLPWRLIRAEADAHGYAMALRSVVRPESGTTNLAAAIHAAVDEFRSVPCEADRRVVDISGDGRHNAGSGDMGHAISAVRFGAIELNALPIVTETEPDVADWYRENVTGPAGGFTIEASWDGFARAIRSKLALEVAAR